MKLKWIAFTQELPPQNSLMLIKWCGHLTLARRSDGDFIDIQSGSMGCSYNLVENLDGLFRGSYWYPIDEEYPTW